jgi:hypothetical protein
VGGVVYTQLGTGAVAAFSTAAVALPALVIALAGRRPPATPAEAPEPAS